MIVDANLLLFASDETSRFHVAARRWLDEVIGGPTRVGLPWQTLAAFLRIGTNPRIYPRPLTPAAAWEQIEAWLSLEIVWLPRPGPSYAEILGRLVLRHEVHGNLVPDAQLAALALEHGVPVASADTDFARFTEVKWVNPVAV
ncbi:MAG: PIN domain-containing protein [Actinobacteria bacterium]|nr:PIN domain-containing protein [Actinomycetota bacterium]